MESNRIWHEPEVIIYGNLITPGTRCSAEAYDLGNRRWYQLNINADIDDDEFMSSIVEKYISTYYHTHGAMPPFNVIHATVDEEITTFETKPNDTVARPINKKLSYNPSATHTIPITFSEELVKKRYLDRGIDRCEWRGQGCVFKRIEFDVDIESIDREIMAREKLIAALGGAHSDDHLDLMQQRFNIIPILAVVLKEASVDEVMGILMPFAGPSLESIFGLVMTPTEQSKPSKGIVITAAQLRDLTCGVRELNRTGVLHGEINDRNTLLSFHEPLVGEERCLEPYRLVLVDLGSVAPEYKTDAIALGQLFAWCSERTLQDEAERGKVEAAARVLQDTGNLDEAILLLGPDLPNGFCRELEVLAEKH